MPCSRPLADDALFATLQASNRGPLPAAAIRGIFRQILSAARLQVKTVRVAYLGPAYSYTHIAAIERFGESADLVPVTTIAAVFEEVNRGQANYGIVPIENSTDGRIVDTLDMFTRLPLRICGEVQIAIHHNLLARSPRSEVTEIYSKPQALSQCREWLSKNMPQARLLEVTSTSTAAQLARDKPGAGAVASMRAAVEYDLNVVAESIQDNKNNVTRFAIIGDDETKPTGKDRTRCCCKSRTNQGLWRMRWHRSSETKSTSPGLNRSHFEVRNRAICSFWTSRGIRTIHASNGRFPTLNGWRCGWKCSARTRGANR